MLRPRKGNSGVLSNNTLLNFGLCNLWSPEALNFLAIQTWVSTSSLSGQRFKGYRYESDMPCYKCKVT